jgi:hypothetical protein
MTQKSTSPSDRSKRPSSQNEYRRANEYRFVPIRQRLIFAKEYVRTGNATAAWKAAFPQSRAEYNSQRASAWKMLNAPKTQDIIDRLRAKSFERHKNTLQEIIAENLSIVRFDPARIFDDDGKLLPWEDIDPADRRCISEVKIDEDVDEDGHVSRTITVKRQERGQALDRLARMLGAYAKDNAQKTEVTVVNDDLLLAQRIAFLLERGIRAGKLKNAERIPITIEQEST